jgi:hypothetical protein
LEHVLTGVSVAIAVSIGSLFFHAQLLLKENDSKLISIGVLCLLQIISSVIGLLYILPMLIWLVPWGLAIIILLVFRREQEEDSPAMFDGSAEGFDQQFPARPELVWDNPSTLKP